MKLNLDQPIKDFDGVKNLEDVKTPATMKAGEITPAVMQDFTFKNAIEKILNGQDEQHILTAEKKTQAFQIGVKIFGKKLKEYDLTTDQVGFLKERIGLFSSPIVYGRFLELIGDMKPEAE